MLRRVGMVGALIEAAGGGGSGRRLLVFAGALLLAACASAPPRQVSDTVPVGAYLRTGASPLELGRVQEKFGQTGLFGYLEEKRGHRLQILELSGGGQYGAFGAGFLNGWSEQGTRPQFDVVTGISTGALLATHAFLGTPADDATLQEVFTGVTQADVYRTRFLDTVFGAPSLFDTQPLSDLIAKHITPEVLERVAAEHAKGRRLFIGATNLDYGQFWVFSMTEIADQGGSGALELYRKVIRASASPPLAFPPVEIAGSLFGDGSVRDNVLIVGISGGGGEIEEAPDAVRGNVYVIHNGRMQNEPRAVRAELTDIAGATFQALFDGRMATSLVRAYMAARIHDYDFNLVSIPDDVETSGQALAFDPGEMRRVFDAGRRLGRQVDPWLHEPPISDQVGAWALAMIRRFDQLN